VPRRLKRLPEFFDTLSYEKELWQKGIKYVAGMDEAGRGPWAGPVVAAAVILPENFYSISCGTGFTIAAGRGRVDFSGIRDSKRLSPKKRKELSIIIKENAVAYSTGIVQSEEIDNLNILQATFKAMKKALEQLPARPQFLLVDGNCRIPGIDMPQLTIIKGDSLSLSIAAASILAKVTRDEIMQKLNRKFPYYGFSRHKGYGTREHEKKLKKFGPSELHRFSFRPVKNFILRQTTGAGVNGKKLGRWGEKRAIKFLQNNGYKILNQNVRTRNGEVDIVAEDNGTVVFIEVKTRFSQNFGRGEEALSLFKQRRLIKVAFQIMKNRHLADRDFRFDVLSLFWDRDKKWKMGLIKNAFEA
jgi:ribonuclease HII